MMTGLKHLSAKMLYLTLCADSEIALNLSVQVLMCMIIGNQEICLIAYFSIVKRCRGIIM